MQGKIIKFSDVQTSIRQYRKFLTEQNITFEELIKAKNEEIEKSNISEEDKEKNKIAVKDVYNQAERNVIKQMVIEYFAMQITANQILIENTFDFVNEKIDELEKEFTIGFTIEDKFSIALDVLNMTYNALSTYSTINFDEEEKKLIEKKAEENLKTNRAFGRETKVSDTLEKE